MKKKESRPPQLRESLFRSVFNDAPERFVVLDREGVVRLVNASALDLLGYAEENVVGRNIREFVLEKDVAELEGFLAAVAESGELRNYKFYFLTSRQSIIRLFLSIRALKGDDGAPEGFRLTLSLVYPDEWSALRDPHFFQAVARKLGRLTSVGQLTSIFAHDIKNPLHVILSTTELMLASGELPAESRESLELVERNAQRASRIVKTLLDFSRSGICQLRPCSVNDIAEHCIGLISSSLKTSKISVKKELGRVPKVFLDPHYLNSVVYNLLNNAAEALGPEGGEIIVATGQKEPGEVCLRITDNGRGMEPGVLSSIFQPFFTTKENGTGLGLYLARQVMNEHSGRITLDSRPGKGTAVTLCFAKLA
ncbi:MAG: ATP-binding protein [Elusimicrobiales bacterium]|nr:ATP-binding protein [Elusimicrobiales bacterium]